MQKGGNSFCNLCCLCLYFKSNLKDVQKPNKDNFDKYQNHIVCSYGYKVVCIYYRFSKTVQTYQGKNAVCKLILKMLKDIEYCKEIIKKLYQ